MGPALIRVGYYQMIKSYDVMIISCIVYEMQTA
jgi:hypothetical protein